MAGYSGTPLITKIGIKPGHRVLLRHSPESFLVALGELPAGVRLEERLRGNLDVMIVFVRTQSELNREFLVLPKKLSSSGMLWVSWPKRSSGQSTDLGEDVVRRGGLEAGLVDVKVCAIDETWAGLKFVYRLKDRERA